MRRGVAGWRRALVAPLVLLLLSGAVIILLNRPAGDPLPPAGPVIWSANQESGDLSEWTAGQKGESVFNTGTGRVEVSQDVAHGGRFSLKMSIQGAAGQTEGARAFRWSENQEEAYYSVWFYIPQTYKPVQWWSIFQFKSVTTESDPMWMVDIDNRPDGSMYLYLWDAIDGRSFTPRHQIDLPVGRWFLLTAYFRRERDGTGRIALWQGTTLLYDIDHVRTVTGDSVHWGICNYTDNIAPPDVTIYADDAEIRTVLAVR